jgi:hypothetical protein
MTIYCIVAHREPAKLGAKIKSLYPDVYELPPDGWLVVDTGTPPQVREKIGLNATGLGAEGVQGIVIQSNGIAGFAPSDIWEWKRAKSESPAGPRAGSSSQATTTEARELQPTSDIRFVTSEIGKLTSKVDRLIEDVGKDSEKIVTVRRQITFVKGALLVIGCVIGFVIVAAGISSLGTSLAGLR